MTTTTAIESAPTLSSIAADRIRGLRAEARMNQTQLARRVGMSRTAVSDREGGLKPVNVDELPAFAAIFGVSVAYLMGLTNDRSRPLEEAASASVRHVGLEPTTRCFRVTRRGELADVIDIRPWILHRERLVEQSQDRPSVAAVVALRSVS